MAGGGNFLISTAPFGTPAEGGVGELGARPQHRCQPRTVHACAGFFSTYRDFFLPGVCRKNVGPLGELLRRRTLATSRAVSMLFRFGMGRLWWPPRSDLSANHSRRFFCNSKPLGSGARTPATLKRRGRRKGKVCIGVVCSRRSQSEATDVFSANTGRFRSRASPVEQQEATRTTTGRSLAHPTGSQGRSWTPRPP